MTIDVLTLFPAMFEALSHSVIGRAQQAGLIAVRAHDIRAYTKDKHRRCDDYPFGGGAGLVMTCQPICDAVAALAPPGARRIYLSPRGPVLTQKRARDLAAGSCLLLLCGHYEGVDERVLSLCAFEELSVGDYVLTGGELPAMTLIDCVARHIPGVLGSDESAGEESHEGGLLEYPQYTRPAEYEGMAVPEVLQNGHHALIAKWRREQSLALTRRVRPDLLATAELTDADRTFLWPEQYPAPPKRRRRTAQ